LGQMQKPPKRRWTGDVSLSAVSSERPRRKKLKKALRGCVDRRSPQPTKGEIRAKGSRRPKTSDVAKRGPKREVLPKKRPEREEVEERIRILHLTKKRKTPGKKEHMNDCCYHQLCQVVDTDSIGAPVLLFRVPIKKRTTPVSLSRWSEASERAHLRPWALEG